VLTLREPPSPASSAKLHEVERSLQTTSQLPEALPMTSPPESYPEKYHDTAESSRVPSVFKRLQTKFKRTKKNQASQPPDQHSAKSGQLIDLFNSQSQPTANIAYNGRSRFSAGQRQARTVGKSVDWRKSGTKAAKPSHPVKVASSSGQESAGTKRAGAAQQANEPSLPSAVTGVHVTEAAGKATLSVAFKFDFPAWMLCLRCGAEDGRH
jgi:hypothetical protein